MSVGDPMEFLSLGFGTRGRRFKWCPNDQRGYQSFSQPVDADRLALSTRRRVLQWNLSELLESLKCGSSLRSQRAYT